MSPRSAATNSAASPTMSIRPAARSAGARASGFPSRSPLRGHLRDHRQRAELRHADVHRLRASSTIDTVAPDLADQQPDDGERRPDVAAQQRLLHRRWHRLEPADEEPRGVRGRQRSEQHRGLRRLAGPHRVPPGRARLCSAAAPAADAGHTAAGSAPNRPPTVTARCEPCTVEVGRTSTVTADAKDPDGDTLTYRWTAPSGHVRRIRPTVRRSGSLRSRKGPVQVTVTVSDGKGGTASAGDDDSGRPPDARRADFEDVYFDFDRSTLRPEALRLLDDAIAKLQANPGRNIVIEGHTCNIGTAEYNLALGDRRAHERPRLPGVARHRGQPSRDRAASAKSGRSTTTPAKRRGV